MTTVYRISGKVGPDNWKAETGYWHPLEFKWVFRAMEKSQFNIETLAEAEGALSQAQDDGVRDIKIEEINYDNNDE